MMVGLPWVQMPCGHTVECAGHSSRTDVEKQISSHRAECQACADPQREGRGVSEPAQDLIRDIAMKAAMRRRLRSVFDDPDVRKLLEEANLKITVRQADRDGRAEQ